MAAKKFIVLLVIGMCLALMTASCGKKGTTGAGGQGGPPPAGLGGNFIMMHGIIGYEDGKEPTSMGQDDMYVFTNIQITLESGTEKITVPAVVKKMNGKYYFGSQVPVEKSPANYKKINSLTFKSEGYKTVVFKNILIKNGEADFQNVILRKK